MQDEDLNTDTGDEETAQSEGDEKSREDEIEDLELKKEFYPLFDLSLSQTSQNNTKHPAIDNFYN